MLFNSSTIQGYKMYSREIDNILKLNNYNIASDTYINISSTSPQITHVKYDPYSQYFEIWTNDDYYWKFNVYRKE